MLETGLVMVAIGWWLAMGSMLADDFNRAFDGCISHPLLVCIVLAWPAVIVACVVLVTICNEQD